MWLLYFENGGCNCSAPQERGSRRKNTKKEVFVLGSRRTAKATLEDETGSIVLNLWRNQIDQCQEGDLVKVSNAFVKFYRGVRSLNTWQDIEVLERAE